MTNPARQRRFGWRWRCAFLVVIMATVFYVCRTPLLVGLGSWLDVGERPRHSDYVVVLPGAPETRPFVAAALVKVGLAHKVLVPTTESDPIVQDGIWPASHVLTKAVLVKRGVPEADIMILEGESSSTFEDAQILRTFLKDRPDVTIAVVTSDYHTRRARWVFRRTLGRKFAQVYFVSAPVDRFDARNWWRVRAGLQTYLSEYLKFAAYIACYGGPAVWIPAALAIAGPWILWRWRTKRLALRARSS